MFNETELNLDANRLSKWQMDPRFNGGKISPNDRLSSEEQEFRKLKKRVKDAELEM